MSRARDISDRDLNGQELILDADGDSSITSDTDDRIDFKTAGTDRMHITSNGNVGIGTSSPTTAHTGFTSGKIVEIENSSTNSDATDNAALQINSVSRHTSLSLQSNSSYSGFIYFGDESDADVGRIQYNHADNTMRFTTNADEHMRLDGVGALKLDGEGGSNLTVDARQGSAKHWANVDQSGTMTTIDSYNQSSVTDLGTGKTRCTINNDMNNDDYAPTVGFGADGTDYRDSTVYVYTPNTTTGRFDIYAGNDSNFRNATGVFPSTHGDLA